jgi:energy-converting hydrogenase Eha subunit A
MNKDLMLLIKIIIIACITLAGTSIVLTSLKVGIGPLPSSGKVRRTVLSAVETAWPGPIMDLGSGWGSFVIALARKYPDRKIIGYELSSVPYYFSSLLKWFLKLDNLHLKREDFLGAKLSGASALVCYLFPGGMVSLEDKLLHELRGHTRVISCLFALPSCTPSRTIRIDDVYKTPVYVYENLKECRGKQENV